MLRFYLNCICLFILQDPKYDLPRWFVIGLGAKILSKLNLFLFHRILNMTFQGGVSWVLVLGFKN